MSPRKRKGNEQNKIKIEIKIKRRQRTGSVSRGMLQLREMGTFVAEMLISKPLESKRDAEEERQRERS